MKTKKSKKTDQKYKTEWNLGLLYSSPKDSKIEKDLKAIEVLHDAFEKKWSNRKDYLENETALFEALKEYEYLFRILPLSSALNYFHYRKDINGVDTNAQSHINILTERLTKNANKILFFNLALGSIAKDKQAYFLQSKKLSGFAYYLTVIFNRAKHNLSEKEEKIMNLKELPSHNLWVSSTESVLSKQKISFKGKEMSIGEATNKVHSLESKDRQALHAKILESLFSISDFAEHEMNAIILNKKISDELRGFKTPFDETVLWYENDFKTVANLTKTVTDNFKISHRFYKLKAKLLGLKKLTYADRNISIGSINKKFDLESGISILENAFFKAHPVYRENLKWFLKNGQIDIFPKLGKTGGAYCSGNVNAPTFVLLNYDKTFDSVMTFAHEMGHAIHTEFSKKQPALYRNYTISVAEVASTFFENFAFEQVFKTLTEKEKIIALHDRINDDIQTIFRQIACFNFELELHSRIRTEGSLSKEKIAELMNKHMKSYLGPITNLTDLDGYFFVYWSHIRRFFYVYSYAFGQLVSKVLYQKYKEDKNFGEKIIQFLSAGGSKSPEDIFKNIGIDVTKPEFFKNGLLSIEKDIDRLESLTKNFKK